MGRAKRAAAAAESKAAEVASAKEAGEAELKELKELLKLGPRQRAQGAELLKKCTSNAEASKAGLVPELKAPVPAKAADVGLSERWVDQLAFCLEKHLFFAGAGDVARTKLVAHALMRRPAIQNLLNRRDASMERLHRVMETMIESAKGVLDHLSTGVRGSRSRADHERFEAIVAALTPDGATDLEMGRAITELLGIHHRQLERALEHRRIANEDGTVGAFSRATAVHRQQRKDYRGVGRCVAINYWHKATRLDTRLGKKKRHREVDPVTGKVFYREHWRHVQYDTDAQIAANFFVSVDYQQYLAEGGLPFSKDVFCQAKCFCIEKSDFQECACPPCTLMREAVRGWHQQRAKWHKEGDQPGTAACGCGCCAKGSAYREASGSLAKLREYMHAPCGKASFPELAIRSGPKATETFELYRRQCCHALLPEEACSHRPPGSKAKEPCKECAPCDKCTWAARMPKCPIEYGDQSDAEWKEYKPRIEPDGRSFQDELVTVKGTRKQLMEKLEMLFADWSPHDWIDRWSAHQRHLTYATFLATEMCISTDFSAQYEHKAFCTRTCEHPARSNMDVFIVTHSPRIENGERIVTTDVWRIFSEAKGSALFHNQALDDIVTYYCKQLGLTRVYVFSDGCRSQYKGKKNFARIAQFPSRIGGVQLVHRFAASHHFKGPHDAYGKDAKVLCRTAERNGKARLASTHSVYYFCATRLPRPCRDGITAKELVAHLPEAPPLPALTPEQQAAETREARAALARAPTREAARRIARRLDAAGLAVPPVDVLAEDEAAAEAEDVDVVMAAEAEAVPEVPMPGHTEAWVVEDAIALAEAQRVAEEPDAAALEVAAQAGAQEQLRAAEADADEDEQGGDFIFDETGARVGAGHAAAVDSDDDDEVVQVPTHDEVATTEPPRKKAKRKARTRHILTQAPGMEASADGEQRVETEAPRPPGMFTASNYFWLYYASAGVRGLTKKVGINMGSGPGGVAVEGEYHAILDDAADADADSIAGSNSTYEFVGMHSDQPELLYVRTYSCACPTCRVPSTVATDYSCCPYMETVGRWRQQTIHSAVNVAAQRKAQLEDIKTFRTKIKPDKLYAAYASYREELGGRPYWLLKTMSGAKTGQTIKVPGGKTIAKNQWFVEAQWYRSTSHDPVVKRYKLLDGVVHVPPDAFIQEHELEWAHEGRAEGESILSDASHVALMKHNYSNVV